MNKFTFPEYDPSAVAAAHPSYEFDCTTPIPASVTSLDSGLTHVTVTHGDFTVDVNIHQDSQNC